MKKSRIEENDEMQGVKLVYEKSHKIIKSKLKSLRDKKNRIIIDYKRTKITNHFFS